MCSSSAAARPVPRRRPSLAATATGRPDREGAASALSYRRIAVARQSADLRAARRGRGGRAIGMQKWGAEFISPWDGRRRTSASARPGTKSLPFAYQVRRSEFDGILIRTPRAPGPKSSRAARVRRVDIARTAAASGAVQAQHATRWPRAAGRRVSRRCLRSRHVSGQSSAAQTAQPPAQQRGDFRSFHAARSAITGEREGHISIYWFDHGWFWFIPLSDGATSVGAVVWPYYLKSPRGPVREFFLEPSRCARRWPSA